LFFKNDRKRDNYKKLWVLNGQDCKNLTAAISKIVRDSKIGRTYAVHIVKNLKTKNLYRFCVSPDRLTRHMFLHIGKSEERW